MPHATFQITPRFVIVLGLFFIDLVHIMISTFFQIPGNFLNQRYPLDIFSVNALYYGLAVGACFCYPIIARKLSLKFTLMLSLLFDMLGLAGTWLSINLGGVKILLILSTIFWGSTLLMIGCCIITYLVLEFPKKIGVAIMGLFAFGDGGEILANIFFNTLHGGEYHDTIFILSLILLSGLILFVATKFIDPPFPKHLIKLRKGTVIWKELHYRLAFFMIAAIGYGLIESIFAIWGEVYLMEFLPKAFAVNTVSIFWFFMLVGQVILLAPLYFFPARKIFPILIVALIFTIYFVQQQTSFSGLATCFAIAGFTCAAILPIIMASMEKEIITASHLSHKKNYLPYIEIGTAMLIGGYFIGIGIMDLYVLKVESLAKLPATGFFHWSTLVTALIGLIILFLHWSSSLDEQES